VKKAFLIFLAIVAVTPLPGRAVTWQVDSSPFDFPLLSVLGGKHPGAYQAALRGVYDAGRGIVSFSYRLPPASARAKLRIFNCRGGIVKNFDLDVQAGSVQWNISTSKVAAGVYLASLRCGTIDKKAQISIVK
jgi:hypothetical protein